MTPSHQTKKTLRPVCWIVTVSYSIPKVRHLGRYSRQEANNYRVVCLDRGTNCEDELRNCIALASLAKQFGVHESRANMLVSFLTENRGNLPDVSVSLLMLQLTGHGMEVTLRSVTLEPTLILWHRCDIEGGCPWL